MCGPDIPPPPDPKETAQAQTSTNVATAIANNQMGMVNQVTPWGDLTYEQTGNYQFTDPTSVTTTQPVGGTTASRTGGMTDYTGGVSYNPYGAGTPGDTTGGATGTISAPYSPTGFTSTTGPITYDIPTYTATVTLPEAQQAALDAQFQTNQTLSETAAEQADFLQGYLGQQIDTSGLPGPTTDIGQLQQKTSIGQAGAPVQSVSPRELSGNINNNLSIQAQAGIERSGPDSYGGNFSQNRQDVENALMGRMDPYLAQNRAALETQLANQGISRGSEAWNNSMRDLERQENDARMSAILGASEEQARMVGMERDRAQFELGAQGQDFNQSLAAGSFANQAQAQDFGQAAQRAAFGNQTAQQQFAQDIAAGNFANQAQAQTFGQQAQNAGMYNAAQQNLYNADLTQANLENSVRQQLLNEQFALRNQPINEITALLSGAQVQNPNLQMQTPGAIPTTDYAGIVNSNYQQQLQAAQMENSASQSLMGGLFGLGAAGIGAYPF